MGNCFLRARHEIHRAHCSSYLYSLLPCPSLLQSPPPQTSDICTPPRGDRATQVERRHTPDSMSLFCVLMFVNVNLVLTYVYTPQTFVYIPQFQIRRNNPAANASFQGRGVARRPTEEYVSRLTEVSCIYMGESRWGVGVGGVGWDGVEKSE